MDCVSYFGIYLQVMVRMNLETRLIKKKIELGKVALRSPTTAQELINRRNWERVRKILMKRYDRHD